MSIATALSGVALFLGLSGGDAVAPTPGWWSAADDAAPLYCPVHDRRYGVRALCGATVYLELGGDARVREVRDAVAAGLAHGAVGPSAPPVRSAEVIDLGEGRAAVVLRAPKRAAAAAVVRWAEGLVHPR